MARSQVVFIDEHEIFNASNPALVKVSEKLKQLPPVDEREFARNVDRIVDLVMDHFGGQS
jgi:hypothetical protein